MIKEERKELLAANHLQVQSPFTQQVIPVLLQRLHHPVGHPLLPLPALDLEEGVIQDWVDFRLDFVTQPIERLRRYRLAPLCLWYRRRSFSSVLASLRRSSSRVNSRGPSGRGGEDGLQALRLLVNLARFHPLSLAPPHAFAKYRHPIEGATLAGVETAAASWIARDDLAGQVGLQTLAAVALERESVSSMNG
jgi:hypothetical protein